MSLRRAALSLVILIAAAPAFARVLSYSPYSNRTSFSGFHERTTRHFVLIETSEGASSWEEQQLVLYDTTGAKEPQVVFPQHGGTARITATALYERKDDPAAPPMLLAFSYDSEGEKTYFSADGGATWKVVAGATGGPSFFTFQQIDFGGPMTQGMNRPFIHIGTDVIPFIVSYPTRGLRTIDANGESRVVDPSIHAYVIGQNHARTRLLTATPQSIVTMNLDGTDSRVLLPRPQGNFSFSGWITADDSAYIQATHHTGRYLFFHREGKTRFVAGHYGVHPPSLTSAWPSTPLRSATDFFAVPTHDFEGAWLLQREAGKPTTLSHYSPSTAVRQMWSDPAGPEVEALIAGASGQTLLIQVHRDRTVQMQRPFIDPALAVWRVGDPMPRQYDELYLNEEINKGFVHVDVDRMAAGDPFVFSSGAIPGFFEDGDFSSPIPGGGDVIQEWGVVRGSLRQHLVLPGVARLNGAFESRWRTDLTIYNPLASAQEVDVRFIALGEPAVQALSTQQKTVTLQPREIRFIPDVLHALFGVEDGGGALHFLPAEGVNVFGRTYSSKTTGGTFGFGMAGIDFYNTASPRFPVTFAGAFPGENFRTNVLLTDTSGNGTEAALYAIGSQGTLAATLKTIDAPAGGVLQFNGLGAALGTLSGSMRGLLVQPTRGTAIATVVAIDNQTNDPTYFPPDLPISARQIRSIPVIGHVDGANGSRFRTDLYLFNPSHVYTDIFTLEAKQWDGPAVKTWSVAMNPRAANVIRDVLPSLFGMTGLARLRYWSDGRDGVRVTSRTYTVDEKGATYGTLIPTLNNFQVAAPGDRLEILGISGGSDFRTNLGLVELSAAQQNAAPANIRVRLLDQKLTELDTFTVSLPRAGGRQINDIFGSRGIAPPEAAMIVVEVLDGGLIGAYATLVDNVTNDATYLGTQLGAKEH